MGVKEPFSSLTSYASSPVVNLVIMSLIIIGGIGFITWDDIRRNRLNFRKYRMQSKIIIVVTAFLIVLPAIYFFFFEFENMSFGKRLLCSLFQAVTPRTAGFNTADMTELSETGQTIIVLLMLIGGSPGSTAGGMKTTTAAVLLFTAFSVFQKKDNTHFFGRRVSHDAERSAAAIALMYIVLPLTGAMIISSIENIPVLTALFEVASAIGTVGLSLGITSNLCMISRTLLIGLMFFGRVGGLTLIFAAFSRKNYDSYKFPQETITVG